jgi:hypothetical protein
VQHFKDLGEGRYFAHERRFLKKHVWKETPEVIGNKTCKVKVEG